MILHTHTHTHTHIYRGEEIGIHGWAVSGVGIYIHTHIYTLGREVGMTAAAPSIPAG